MEEGRLQDVNPVKEHIENLNIFFNELDDSDFKKAQCAINMLLFKKGVVDGSIGQEEDLYHFLIANFDSINSYLETMGLRLMSDTAFHLVWTDVISTEEGRLYSPFQQRPMSANQLILLAVLQKRFATKSSSKDIGIEDAVNVLLTEQDIIKDMYDYMKSSDDDWQKNKDALAAIKFFCDELGILKLFWEDRILSDGSKSKVYRVSPFIGHQFGVDEMDKLIASVKEFTAKEEPMQDEEGDTDE